MEHRFEIFADHFQLYLQDNDIRFGDLSEAWTDEAVEKMLALGPHVIGVGTARNMTVPVTVRICKARPTSAMPASSASTNARSRSTPAAS